MKVPGKCTGPKYLSICFGKWKKRHLGGHDLVRRMDRQGEVLIWCRKCSGYARQKMGRKLRNCCKPEQVGTKRVRQNDEENSNSRRRRVPAKEVRNWKIERQRRRITRRDNQSLFE